MRLNANSESFWSHFWLQLKIALVGSNSVGGHCTKNLANLILCLCSRVSQLSLAPTQYTWTWIFSLWGEILSYVTVFSIYIYKTDMEGKSRENIAKCYWLTLAWKYEYSFRNDFNALCMRMLSYQARGIYRHCLEMGQAKVLTLWDEVGRTDGRNGSSALSLRRSSCLSTYLPTYLISTQRDLFAHHNGMKSFQK